MTKDNDNSVSGNMPDHFDRTLGSLEGFAHTRASTVTDIPPMGVGGSRTFIIQTYRVKDMGDTVFLQMIGPEGATRIVIPPKVAAVIASQRDAITAKTRSASAKATAAERKRQGLQPGFMKKVGG